MSRSITRCDATVPSATVNLTAVELLTISRALAIAVERNRAELCQNKEVDLDAFQAAAQKLYEAALGLVAGSIQ